MLVMSESERRQLTWRLVPVQFGFPLFVLVVEEVHSERLTFLLLHEVVLLAANFLRGRLRRETSDRQ